MIWILLIMSAFLIMLILSIIAKTKNKVINTFFLVGFIGSLIYLGFSEYKFYSNNIQIWKKYFNYVYLPVYTDSTQQYFLEGYYTNLIPRGESELDIEFTEDVKMKFPNGEIMYIDKDSNYVKFKINESEDYIYFTLDNQFYNYIYNMW